ncbi:MAG: sugar ABC transporter ATP-binding protein [Alphaproteobacteria bacterium]|jgi:ribose transport system ATP-binding protein|uniref:sugar ABC transporter ATP-binding protein n=1 Tax=Devosia sp. XGJD_8 TaxID=3391187 RepID=UPI001D421E6A|nr:sugar ABC transporter ATP-binding protein [Alphaproteobacteria bacterium]MBU1563436.1 sugar ABC transporter ATP-binding protein [Alphaproteobacteria bacterium]MBU2301075.1 sugar ABC transporter ATP-binding protein [Alphaproteobacteria bacterium]MBU2368388.1 sugar ABC transporter ATP-binding protein [Alphaproteobacteria bacterium]
MTSAEGTSGPAILSANRISKSFGEIPVLFSVDFDIRPGEVHAIIGENGAGKSTLIKILSGIEQPTSGSISYDGKTVVLPPNGEAEAMGIVLIHQEMNLAEHLTVADSIFLGREIKKYGFLDLAEMRRRSAAVMETLHVHVDPDARINTLPVADKQMVEIAKAISRDARVLIMDEPTAVLSVGETETLFEQIRRLTARGVAVIFISHKLDEIMELADRVTVLRDGQLIATVGTEALTPDSIAQMMVGRELSNLYPPKHEPDIDAPVVLSVRNLSAPGVSDISFDLRRGEILGFAGLIGSGRTAVAEAIVGLLPKSAGQVEVNGKPANFTDVAKSVDAGLAYMTKDRKGRGLLLNVGLQPNLTLLTLKKHLKNGFLDGKSEEQALDRAVRRFDIRARDASVRVGQLSGGNQQKLMLGKTMESEPDIIIMDEPTRGIDVGTKQQIYHIIAALAAEGKSIIVISSEMQEVIGLSHRVLVMRNGRLAGRLEGAEISEAEIMRYAAGIKQDGDDERISA